MPSSITTQLPAGTPGMHRILEVSRSHPRGLASSNGPEVEQSYQPSALSRKASGSRRASRNGVRIATGSGTDKVEWKLLVFLLPVLEANSRPSGRSGRAPLGSPCRRPLDRID